MVEGWDPELINPASLDVRIGNHLMIEVVGCEHFVEIDISECTKDRPYRLLPGEFCLAATQEVFNIPRNLCAEFALKSSRGREGYQHMLSAWIDPGFTGSALTLELKNARKQWDLPIYPGLKIGQIIFMKMHPPLRDYSKTGRYNGDLKVTGSKG